MASILAAGFAAFRTSVRSWSKASVAGDDCSQDQIASGTCENAGKPEQLELERLGRRAAAASQFQEMLTDLRGRIARKAAARTLSAGADRVVPKSPTKAA